MTLYYDEAIFQEFRAKAITNAADFEIGKRYWSTTYPRTFVIKEIITQAESCRRKDIPVYPGYDDITPALFVDENGIHNHFSDRNVGESYNPWLIFDNEADYKECEDKLEVKFSTDDYWDDYDYQDDVNYAYEAALSRTTFDGVKPVYKDSSTGIIINYAKITWEMK